MKSTLSAVPLNWTTTVFQSLSVILFFVVIHFWKIELKLLRAIPSSVSNFILKLFLNTFFTLLGILSITSAAKKKSIPCIAISALIISKYLSLLMSSVSVQQTQGLWLFFGLSRAPVLLNQHGPICQHSKPHIFRCPRLFAITNILISPGYWEKRSLFWPTQKTLCWKHFSLQPSASSVHGIDIWMSQDEKVQKKTTFVIFDKRRISLQRRAGRYHIQVIFLVNCRFPARKTQHCSGSGFWPI